MKRLHETCGRRGGSRLRLARVILGVVAAGGCEDAPVSLPPTPVSTEYPLTLSPNPVRIFAGDTLIVSIETEAPGCCTVHPPPGSTQPWGLSAWIEHSAGAATLSVAAHPMAAWDTTSTVVSAVDEYSYGSEILDIIVDRRPGADPIHTYPVIDTLALPRVLDLLPGTAGTAFARTGLESWQWDDSTNVWRIDLQTGAILESIPLAAMTIAVSADGGTLFAPNRVITDRLGSDEITVWTTDSTFTIELMGGEIFYPSAIRATPDGKTLYVYDHFTDLLWTVDLDGRAFTGNLRVGGESSSGLELVDGGATVLLWDALDDMIWAVAPANGTVTEFAAIADVGAIAVSARETELVVQARDSLHLVSWPSGELVFSLPTDTRGRPVVAGDGDRAFLRNGVVVDLVAGEESARIRAGAAMTSADGTRLYARSFGGIVVYDIATRR